MTYLGQKYQYNFKKIKGIIIWCVLIAIPILSLTFGSFIIDNVCLLHQKVQVKLSEHLHSKQQVIFLSTLDESIPYDLISLLEIDLSKVPLEKGKYGNARKFDLNTDKYNFTTIGDLRKYMRTNGTYSLWIKPHMSERKQLIINAKGSKGGLKLFIQDNKLILSYKGKKEYEPIVIPSQLSSTEFSHIAITYDNKSLLLFINGEQKVNLSPTEGIAIAPRPLHFSPSLNTFNGVIDDIAIFYRTLSSDEIKKIATSQKNIKKILAPILSFVEDVTRKCTSIVSSIYRIFGHIIPLNRQSAILNSKIPSLVLKMSIKDERYFKKHHEKSLINGHRTKKAANFRKIHIMINQERRPLELALDDVYHFKTRSKRQSYLVRDSTKKIIKGSGILRLYPPELHLSIHNDAPKPFPLKANLIKLYIGDSFKGIYIIEAFDREGSAWMAYDERRVLKSSTLYVNGAPAYEDIIYPNVNLHKNYEQTIKIITSDMQFPWSLQEIKAKEIQNQRTRNQLQIKDFKPTLMPIRDILGSNRASLYITTNLNLSHQDYIWKSSNPQILSNLGEVSRPEGHAPKFVKLTCEEKGTKKTQEFTLRVMPLEQPIDTLFIYIGQSLSKTQRADFTCLRLPKNGGKPEWNIGFASQNSGIKQRGNTSYVVAAKRSLSLKFNEPVNWANFEFPSKHIILHSGYSDITRLHNKISFDAFSSCSDGESPHYAPKIFFSEVFINDEYFGIYETSQRVKDFCPENTLLYKVRAKETRLWEIDSTEMVECISDYAQNDENPYAPLNDLFTFVMNSTTKSLAKNGETKLWFENLTTFFLILNFSENYDGIYNNQYIACDPKLKKWYLVPWDYDKTYFGKPNAFLENSLLRKIRKIPGMQNSISAKWTTLRKGPLSNKSLFNRINADTTIIKPYLKSESMWLYPELETTNIDKEIARLKKIVKMNLRRMDNTYLIKEQP